MIDLKTAALVGGVGAVGALWQNIKNVFAYIGSIFVVTVEFQYSETGEAFLMYAWKNFKYIPLGVRRVDIWHRYIKPKARTGAVAHECSSETMTFIDGWRPIFVKKEKGDYGYKNQTTLRFLRGTINVEKLMATIASEFDDKTHKSNMNQRFEVKRFFGKTPGMGNDQTQDNPYMKGYYAADSTRPIGYEKIQLGTPKSNDPWKNLSYNREIMEFKDEIVKWKNSEKWYKDRGLPWRFGAGCYGLPGSGKTSLIRAVSQELDLPIHIYDLTTMSNEELTKFWQQSLAAAPCVVLFEDIDRIFDPEKKVRGVKDKPPLTLDCLLNLVNGVEPAEGIMLFVTANDMTKIDPALGVLNKDGEPSRPGRLDRIVIFGTLDEEARGKIAKRILIDSPHLIDKVVAEGKNETGAQFEARCSKLALKGLWGDGKVYGPDDFDVSTVGSAYVPGTLKTSAEIKESETESSSLSGEAAPTSIAESVSATISEMVGETVAMSEAEIAKILSEAETVLSEVKMRRPM